MKSRFLIFVMLNLLSVPAYPDADKGLNGGDICEDRFKSIRNDLTNWIKQGGSGGLVLPNGLSTDQYNSQMSTQLLNAQFNCTDSTITVGNAEKTCKNFTAEDGLPWIVCNIDRFMKTSESDQYVLVHHEYAGLAKLEMNSGDSSKYSISNQISEYLVDQVVKKLAVKTDRPSAELLQDSFGGVALQLNGSMGGVAEEIFNALKAAVQDGKGNRVDLDGSHTIYISKSVRAYVNVEETRFRVIIDSQVSGPATAFNLQEGIKKGQVSLENSGLFEILNGHQANENLRIGKFVRCTPVTCEISLNGPIENPVPAKNCELSINRIATVSGGGIYNGNTGSATELVLLVAEVRKDLRDQVLEVVYGSEKMDPVPGMSGFYRDDLVTQGYLGSSAPVSTVGNFRLRLKDGRVFELRPRTGDQFVIDTFFAKNTGTVFNQPPGDEAIGTIPTTSHSKNGSAQYINPYQCE